MTITSLRVFEPTESRPSHKDAVLPPPKTYPAPDPPFRGYTEPPSEGYKSSSSSTAIVIDAGSWNLRAGWSFDKSPRLAIPPLMARYRDRKLSRACQYVGWDAYADATTRGQIRTAFEPGSNVIASWDVVEGVMDYTFLRLGLGNVAEGDGIGRPVVMTEPVANLGYCRRMTNEILFECYGAPSVAYGIDALLSYKYNKGKNGLVVSSGHSATHMIPVLDGKPVLTSASRLNWGGWHSADYLLKLLRLKYSSFPAKITETQAQQYVRDHCYISPSFEREMNGYLEWSGLEDRERIIQYPFTEQIVQEKTEEELAKIAERKKESGRRLQEQAAKMRLEKLVQKEEDLTYYQRVKESLENQTKKEIKRILDDEDFKDEDALDRHMKELERKIKRARAKDLGQEPEEGQQQQEEPTFPLLEVPDDQLDEAGLKQKRHQRLMKSGFEARARAKAEKAAEAARIEEARQADEHKRTNDLPAWLEEKRAARQLHLQRIKERERLKADAGNRKSLASQIRMKTLANLASDGPRKRRKGGNPDRDDDDTFGANDDDWGVYRTVAVGEGGGPGGGGGGGSDDEDDEQADPEDEVRRLEALLLENDPEFDESKTLDAQSDWSKSLVHAFLYGPRAFDAENTGQAHQLHLNVERIRVPEVLFQPAIAGVDQAGLVEIAVDILTQRIIGSGSGGGFGAGAAAGSGAPATAERDAVLRDIFVTGGNTLFRGFADRFREELRACLPVDAPLVMRQAADPLLDAWRGAAQWAGEMERAGGGGSSGSGGAAGGYAISREEFQEKGSEYLKEHEYGNGAALF